MKIYTGCRVEVVDPNHPMKGWHGWVTSPVMWSKPIYKKIPEGSFRIEMDSGEGRFYGDYRADQLRVLGCPGDK